jgi:hypothetical protein
MANWWLIILRRPCPAYLIGWTDTSRALLANSGIYQQWHIKARTGLRPGRRLLLK